MLIFIKPNLSLCCALISDARFVALQTHFVNLHYNDGLLSYAVGLSFERGSCLEVNGVHMLHWQYFPIPYLVFIIRSPTGANLDFFLNGDVTISTSPLY